MAAFSILGGFKSIGLGKSRKGRNGGLLASIGISTMRFRPLTALGFKMGRSKSSGRTRTTGSLVRTGKMR